ncbi:Chaperone protein dnaJ 72 [Platanthera zijinensis]|uniref:Chaperone protein dnaJ 72 n=1 Tax=Platanthera zijinensis TaxID=2320716 RepID=A0AAP0FZN5_9ASPA
MSPAMVDFRSPALDSSKLQSSGHGSDTSVADRIPSFPSHTIFRSGGIPEPSPLMDRLNLGQGVSLPDPPFGSSSSSSEKLSVPRFRKPRKHSGTSWAKPATVASDSGAPLDRAEDSVSHSVREKLHGWKPFTPDASSQSSSGAGFVFGACSSRSIPSSSNTVFDNSSGNPGSGIFVFGSGIEKGSNPSRSSSQSSSAQSLPSAESAKFEGTATILGAGTSSGSNVKNIGTGLPRNDSVCSLGGDNVCSDAGVFVFGSRTKKNDNSVDDLLHEQTERTRKIDLGVSSNVDCQISSMHSNESSIFSSSKLPEELRKHKIIASDENASKDAGAFVFGIGVNMSACASKSSSSSASESSFSKLPEKMEKLSLHRSAYEVHEDSKSGVFVSESSAKHAQFGTTFPGLNEGGFSMFPGELKNQNLQSLGNDEHGSDNHGVFVFGVQKKANSGKSSSVKFDESLISKLPDEIAKMKLSCLGNDDNSQKSFSKFSRELKNQNLQSSGNEEHESDNHGVFVFGVPKKANSGKSSSVKFDDSLISKLPVEVGKMKLSSSGNDDSSQKSKPVDILNQHDNKSAFVSFDFTSQSGEEDHGLISKLPDEIGKLKLSSSGNGDNSQKSKPVNIFNQHDNNSAFVSSNFTLPSGEDHGSRVSPLQAHNSCGLNGETTSFPSPVPGFQSSGVDFCFPGMHAGSETPIMEFRSEKQDTSMLTKENLFNGPHKSMTFSMKKEDYKGLRLKKKRGKAKQSTPIPKQFVPTDKEGLDQEQDSTCRYSPMDYSPYQETLVSSHCSREESVASDESIHFGSKCTSNDARRSCSVDRNEGELLTSSAHFCANEGPLETGASECGLRFPSPRHFTSENSWVDPGLQKENLAAKNEAFGSDILKNSSSMESESFSYYPSIKHSTYEGSKGFTFASNCKDDAQSNFLFAATSSVQGSSSESRRTYRRRSRVKGAQDSHPNVKVPLAFAPSNLFLFTNSYAPTGPEQEQKGSGDGERTGKYNATKPNEESVTTAAASVTSEEICEKWRLRGNQAYADGNLSKAEDYYSRGVDSFPLKEVSRRYSRALMLCYSNRAATRMSLGRLREALRDCKMAVAIDPSFLRARVRAGNILLSLGEPADALKHFEKVLQIDKEAKSDQKIILEAVDGLEKIQKLNDLVDQSSIFLAKRTPDDASRALEIISEALTFGPYSETLLEMKAEALVKTRNFEEAIQICEQTLELAEKNAVVDDLDSEDDQNKSFERSSARLWRWRIISKSYFCLGKLEEANELLKKHEKVKPFVDKYWNRYPESSASFPATVCELLRLKTAGNDAFQAGKHLEAVEYYTAALALNTESRPFTAICFCNRAAAYQALGQITDAIADCSLAIALDSNYRKAISRRATLHEMIRDYGQAATDLQNLTSLLEMSSDDKSSANGTLARSSSSTSDLNQARIRLCTVEEEARKGGALDLYMILGIERSCSAADVRKAYRKAALRHHPDKAGQFLARNENGDDRVWREVAEEVHTNADRLFKMIGEAYTILVDASKRLQYDTELELRTSKKTTGSYGGSCSPGTPASSHSSQFERSTDPRNWRSYGSARRQWSNR